MRKCILMVFLSAAALLGSDPNGVIVHEWGTFTSIAGEDGKPVEWQPWSGPSDLPCFVDRFSNKAKASYAGKVRMETPVLYFYSPRQATLDVRVQFRQGLITEWYPSAAVTPEQYFGEIRNPAFTGTIEWKGVRIAPETNPRLLREGAASHYYAARDTDAAPLSVGNQHEKFLFYRGIANFDVPLTATLSGDSVIVGSAGAGPLSSLILFDNSAGRIRFEVSRSSGGRQIMQLAARDSNLAALRAELVEILSGAGLYRKEAEAMVATWHDSWFEEGSRLLYLVPQSTLGRVLPLDITPAPAKVARVFVGRVELTTPATLERLKGAIRTQDLQTIQRYGRFIDPIRKRVLAELPQTERRQAEAFLQSAAAAYFGQSANACR
jgi:hypothetical protein